MNTSQSSENPIKYWWMPMLVGALFVILGAWVLKTPLEAFIALSFLFAVSFLFGGIIEIIFAFSSRDEFSNWGWVLALGIMNLILGVLLITHPAMTAVIFPLYIGFLIMFRSVGAIALSMEMKSSSIGSWGWMLFLGILGVIVAFIMIAKPGIAGLEIVFWTGIGLIVAGIFNMFLSWKLKAVNVLATTPAKE